MATLNTLINLRDNMSVGLSRINTNLTALRTGSSHATASLDNVSRSMINQSGIAGNLVSGLKNLILTYAGFRGLSSMANISDSLTTTATRLGLINDGSQSNNELLDMVMSASKRGRMYMPDFAANVSKLGLLAPNAFSSNKELVRFSELMSKSFKVSGASTQERTAGMYQLTQAMASGRLQGDEFRSIMENAPMLAKAVADYMGLPMGKLKDLAKQGAITANVIKNALFAKGKDIETMFRKMPKTFSDAWITVKNSAIKAFEPIIGRLSQVSKYIVDNEQIVINFFNAVSSAVLKACNVLDTLWGNLKKAFDFVMENWSVVTMLLSIAAAFWVVELAVKAWAAAQLILDASIIANPYFWIAVAIIGLIYIIIGAINKWKNSSTSATGVIIGALFWLASFIINVVIGAWNLLIRTINIVWNFIAEFVNNIANWFHHPIESISSAFIGLGECVLGVLDTIAQAIDTLFGSKLQNKTEKWLKDLKKSRESIIDKARESDREMWEDLEKTHPEIDADGIKPYTNILNKNPLDFLITDFRLDLSDAIWTGYDLGEAIDKIPDTFKKLLDKNKEEDVYADILSNINKNTADMSDKLSTSDDKLKVLTKLAETDTINKFTTAEVTVNLGGVTNNTSSNTDLDGIVTYLADKLTEELTVVAEGEYN